MIEFPRPEPINFHSAASPRAPKQVDFPPKFEGRTYLRDLVFADDISCLLGCNSRRSFVLHEDDGTITSGKVREKFKHRDNSKHVAIHLTRCSPTGSASCTTKLLSHTDSKGNHIPWAAEFHFPYKDISLVTLNLSSEQGRQKERKLQDLHWEGISSFSRGGIRALIGFVLQELHEKPTLNLQVRYTQRPSPYDSSDFFLDCIDDAYESIHDFHEKCWRAFLPPDFLSELDLFQTTVQPTELSKDNFPARAKLSTGSFKLYFPNHLGEVPLQLAISLSQERKSGKLSPIFLDRLQIERKDHHGVRFLPAIQIGRSLSDTVRSGGRSEQKLTPTFQSLLQLIPKLHQAALQNWGASDLTELLATQS